MRGRTPLDAAKADPYEVRNKEGLRRGQAVPSGGRPWDAFIGMTRSDLMKGQRHVLKRLSLGFKNK